MIQYRLAKNSHHPFLNRKTHLSPSEDVRLTCTDMSTSNQAQSTMPAGGMGLADTADQQGLWDRHDAEQLQLWKRHAELTQQNKDVFTWYALRGAKPADTSTSNRTAELSVVDMFENPEDLFKAVYNSQSGSSTVDLLRASSVVSANTAWADIKAGVSGDVE